MTFPGVGESVWLHRHELATHRERLRALCDAVGRPTDLAPFQWTQLLATTLELRPRLVLELGRGYGNSTCLFSEAANLMGLPRCRVVSLCLTEAWHDHTVPQLRPLVTEPWFDVLEARTADIISADFESILSDADPVIVFWDAHGFDVAEVVLSDILPILASRSHVVAMHDMADARYLDASSLAYDGSPIWRGGNDGPEDVLIGNLLSKVEQAVAITDFTARNSLELHSVDEELYLAFGTDIERRNELTSLLGDDLFSLEAQWRWFSLEEANSPLTFPSRRALVTESARLPISTPARRVVRGILRRLRGV